MLPPRTAKSIQTGMETHVTNRASKAPRLARDDWLAGALDALVRKGVAAMRIDALSGHLGVTKGSFYWHFKSRDDFVKSLLDYWRRAYTMNVVEEIDNVPGGPGERLLALILYLQTSKSAKYDVAIRAWAARDSKVDACVKEVDSQRFDYVRSLFAEMGFKGAELEMRTQIFTVFHSFEEAFLSRMEQPAAERRRLTKLRHAFFTRK